ncbi:hypothetical protein ACT29H_05860 [Thermophagus sp. OGC60D27]|uniref:hypothetical protein n=1 Tax=Thermophagus sp. OGC60D27 TaxID=3458415 RepID=UPI0040382048
MKNKLVVSVFFLLMLFVFCMGAQQDSVFLLSTDEVNLKYGKKLKRAERKIEKGAYFYEKADGLRVKIEEEAPFPGKNPLRMAQLEERVYRLQLKASTYYEEANHIQLRLLKKYLETEHPGKFAAIEGDVKDQFREGYVKRKRAERMVPGQSPLSYVQEAYEAEAGALRDLLAIMVPRKDESAVAFPAEAEEGESAEGVSDQLETAAIVSETLKNVKPKVISHVETTISKRAEKKVFFSIQFMATRKDVAHGHVKQIYNGGLPVIEVKDDGWYKFSAGRFDSVGEALRIMKEQGIQGFIVAFEGEERISLQLARRVLQNR